MLFLLIEAGVRQRRYPQTLGTRSQKLTFPLTLSSCSGEIWGPSRASEPPPYGPCFLGGAPVRSQDVVGCSRSQGTSCRQERRRGSRKLSSVSFASHSANLRSPSLSRSLSWFSGWALNPDRWVTSMKPTKQITCPPCPLPPKTTAPYYSP